MTAPVLEFRGVTLRYGRTAALDDVDLAVEPGSVVGLVGRNGAGKTTALRLAHGQLFADGGTVRVFGLDPRRDGVAIRRRAGLLSEETAIYPWMRVGEILDLAAALHPGWDRELARRLASQLELDRRPRVGALSRGQKAKVGLAIAAATKPELLLLDDPTAGLDPLVRREVLEGLLDTMAEHGSTVVYASHLIHDVERVADRIVFLDEGRIRLDAPLADLKREVVRAEAVFESGEPPDGRDLPGRIASRVAGRVLEVEARAGREALERALRERGASSVAFAPLPLEDILIALLRREAKEAAHG